jgi:hypothetical protein
MFGSIAVQILLMNIGKQLLPTADQQVLPHMRAQTCGNIAVQCS